MRQVDQDTARLHEYIRQAAVGQNSRLPPERELAAKLGITRNQLRPALRKLANEGVIWRHVGKGTFLGPRPSLVGMSLKAEGIRDLTNPREVMTARLALEPALARLAALHATGRDLLEVGRCMSQMADVRDWESWEYLDCRLHRLIAQSANNALMLAMFETVQANRSKEIWGKLRERVEPATSIERASCEHAAIVQAIRDRDPAGAERMMREHLRAVERNCFGET